LLGERPAPVGVGAGMVRLDAKSPPEMFDRLSQLDLAIEDLVGLDGPWPRLQALEKGA